MIQYAQEGIENIKKSASNNAKFPGGKSHCQYPKATWFYSWITLKVKIKYMTNLIPNDLLSLNTILTQMCTVLSQSDKDS